MANPPIAACLAVAAVLQGCAAHEASRASALRHEQAGIEAQRRGDWVAATEHWRRASVDARSGPKQQQAVYLYEYGRSLGATCQFAYAEEALLEAAKLDEETGGPSHMDRVELARLNLDQGLHAAAKHYFEQALPLLEAAAAEREAPTGFADFLDEYAVVLRETGDPRKADAAAARAREVRAADPGGKSLTDRTPYGKHCPAG